MSFKSEEERRDAAEKMIREAGQIATLLAPASPSLAASRVIEDAPQEAISALAEVLKSDLEMVSLGLHGFIKKYPDMSQEQLVCLLRYLILNNIFPDSCNLCCIYLQP